MDPQEPILERPKSPWTPSYSVTRQGSAQLEPDVPVDRPENFDPLLPVLTDEPGIQDGSSFIAPPNSSDISSLPKTSTLVKPDAPIPADVPPEVPNELTISPKIVRQDAQPEEQGATTAPPHVDSSDLLGATVTSDTAEPVTVKEVLPQEPIKSSEDVTDHSTDKPAVGVPSVANEAIPKSITESAELDQSISDPAPFPIVASLPDESGKPKYALSNL